MAQPIDLGNEPQGRPPTGEEQAYLREAIGGNSDAELVGASAPSIPYDGLGWLAPDNSYRVYRNGEWISVIDTAKTTTAVGTVTDVAARLALGTSSARDRIIKQTSDFSVWCLKPGGSPAAGGDWELMGYYNPAIANVSGLSAELQSLRTDINAIRNPAVAPGTALTVTAPSPREIGSSTAYTLTWAVTKNTRTITGITVDGTTIPPINGGNQNGSVTGNFANATGSFTRSIVVTDGTLSTTRNVTVDFLPRMYFSSIAKNTGITDADILALPDIPALTGSELRSNRNKTLTNFGGGGKYMIFVIPTSFGTPTFVVNGITTTFDLVRGDSDFVNAYGVTIRVNVYVSTNVMNASVSTLTIS